MSTRVFVSVSDYLTSSYDPDCDYIDGHLEERNVGEWDHASLQMRVSAYLYSRQDQWEVRVVPELRIRVAPTRFRVPDVCVVLGEPGEQVLTKPPFICIEILSPEDRMSRLQERINDYLRMGVRYVWILDPTTRQAYAATAQLGLREIKDVLATKNPAIEVPLIEIFQ